MKRTTLLKDAAYLILGNFILVCAVAYFIIPFKILSGGMAGVAVAIQPLVNIREEVIIYIIVVTTFILGTIFLGKEFAIKTIVSSILYPLFLTILLEYPIHINIDPVLASLYAGLIAGIGIGLVFKRGASTGGMDVPALILHKVTHVKLATLVMIIDALTILLGVSTRGIEAVLIGLVSVVTTGYAVDKVLVSGGQHAKMVYIISEKYQTILFNVQKEIDRGTTIISARGGFTGDEKPMLLTVVSANQYPLLHDLVIAIDPNAFLIVSDATEVKGEGFSFEYKI